MTSNEPPVPTSGSRRRARSAGADDGRRTRWEAHRAERRDQLVEAALAVLAEVGPEFGLDQVAERAGVTKPVIYRHFADRAGLVAEMGRRATATMLHERILPALQDHGPILARIRRTIDAFLAFLEDNPNIYWLFVHHAPAGGDDVARTNKDLVGGALAALLGDFLRAGNGDAGMAEVWARGLVGFVQNTTEWWLERPTMTRDSLTGYLTTLVWAQIDGLARRHDIALDPDEPLDPEALTRKIAGHDHDHDSSHGAAG